METLTTHPDAFPPNLPPDLDDHAAITHCDWAAFDELTEMSDHWQRPGWSADTRAFYWLLPVTDPLFLGQARHCQETIGRQDGLDAFDFIRPDGFHLTLGRIARRGEVTDQQLDQLAATTQLGVPDAFALDALPLTGSRGALRYSVAPWTPVIALHRHLADAPLHCGLPSIKGASRFRPHIGIGYCHRTLPARSVRPAIQSLRELPPVRLLVDHVELVEMRREGAAYCWEVIHRIRLSGRL
ncbi:2'-5' RNA ligase family protein [Streptomyces sp. NPDC058471]|uniref:2'-5' RNA ligase family protein n=1 Tax=Streptomyces sp. NPDC058471 TaxID=3346516 RepID=UPI0036511A6A